MIDSEAYLRAQVEMELKRFPRSGDLQQVEAYHSLRVIDAVGAALVSVGALEESIGRAILYQFRQFLIEDGIADPKTIFSGAFGFQEPVGPPSWEPLKRRAEPDLIKVISVGKDLGPLPGAGSVLILSVELWSDHTTMRFVLFGPRDAGTQPPNWAWRLRDDLGTIYRSNQSLIAGGPPWTAENVFMPSVAKGATKLIILSHRIGDPPLAAPPGASWRAPGPVEEQVYTFEVPLET